MAGNAVTPPTAVSLYLSFVMEMMTVVTTQVNIYTGTYDLEVNVAVVFNVVLTVHFPGILPCLWQYMRCATHYKCVGQELFCDGYANCPDGSGSKTNAS